MKRWGLLLLVALLGIFSGALLAHQVRFGILPVQAVAVAQEGAIAVSQVVADARVVPVQQADLSMPVSGIVAELLAADGQAVAAGEVILRLKNAQQNVAVARAQADLQRAQARLDELRAGARPQEIAAAEAALAAAQARYNRLVQAALPGDIAAAEAALAASQAAYQKVAEGASDQQLIAARADLANSEALLSQAQNAYNQVKWRNDIGALPQSAALQQATNNYEAARARLADLEAGASQADFANVGAQVRRSRAQLDALKAGLPSDLAAAEADVRASQAQLELLQAGARLEVIAAAEADVAAATALLQQALVSLADTELRAPFAGTVARLNVQVGEQVAPGTPVVQLADLSRWQIETEDLTELDITRVTPGKAVKLQFDALPDLSMTGKVKLIRPIGEDNRGDIVYTVVIDPERQDAQLLWNMTAVVEVE